MADVSLQPIASKLVKEIAMYGGDIARFVSPPVREEVIARVREQGLKGDY
jgi:pantetheine-phosphate adenylyltransferase